MISEAQRVERKSGIGGSDAAAVLGLSPWATPLTIWLDKTGRAAPRPETPQMKYGSYFEDYVAQLYSEHTGRTVQRYNTMILKGCLLGNFDRLVVMPGEKMASHKGNIRTDTLLECKTAGWMWNDEAPIQYQIQVLHYLGLSDKLRHADIAVMFRSNLEFKVFRVERDDDVIAAMQERLTDWWERYVVADVPPPPANEDDCKLLWARSNPGKSVTASEDIAKRLDEYRDAVKSEKAAKELAQHLKDDICAFMQDAEVLVGPDGRPLLTWKSAKDGEVVDWEAVAKSLATPERVAEAAAKFTTAKAGSRRFTPKPTRAA